MPGKSKHRKGKYLAKRKKGEGGVSRPSLATQPPAATQAQRPEPVSSPARPVPLVSGPVLPAKPKAQHPYIATELLTIGILAGIMLIILFVLDSVLP